MTKVLRCYNNQFPDVEVNSHFQTIAFVHYFYLVVINYSLFEVLYKLIVP
jgi:hypothetical protein